MKHIVVSVMTGGCMLLAAATVAFASGKTPQTPTTGQPNFTCATDNSQSPGHTATSTGSPFNETPGGTAGQVYAGNGPGSAHANSTIVAAQYDVACSHNQSQFQIP